MSARRPIEFELGWKAAIADQVIEAEWGRALLTPSLSEVWDASLIVLKTEGLAMAKVAALADSVLGEAGFSHRTVAIPGHEEGERLGGAAGEAPGWEVERTEYMVWNGDPAQLPAAAVDEAAIAVAAPLRAALTGEFMPAEQEGRERTIGQLVELNRRASAVAGDRWFLAPPEAPLATCCLLAGDGVGQVEDVGTLQRARGRGLGKAVTAAATRASLAADHELTFLAVDADDWPRLMYATLGYEAVGEMVVLRRYPD